MKLFRTPQGVVLQLDCAFFRLPGLDWDELLNRENLAQNLRELAQNLAPAEEPAEILPPVGKQEVWAAGVTYLRSRDARMEESRQTGGDSFYDRVYDADRPELFFKAAPWRVIGSGGDVRIRRDSHWNVPEPEFTLFINASGKIVGCTIGNDMSSRDIEGENPLYLPQAKSYDGSCALGPCLLVAAEPLPPATAIEIEIRRAGAVVFNGATSLAQIKRSLPSLAEFLFRETSFPHGCYLMTGTGVVPPDGFTLALGDEIRITIAPIGTLTNFVR